MFSPVPASLTRFTRAVEPVKATYHVNSTLSANTTQVGNIELLPSSTVVDFRQ